MLTVAVDATPLLGHRTGIGTAVAGLIEELAGRDGLGLTGYGLTGTGWRDLPRNLPAGVAAARGPMPAGPLMRLWARTDHPVAERWCGAVDVVHGTNFVVPPTRDAGSVVSVWDLTAVRFPELCAPASLRYPDLVRRAVSRGAWVHTGARFVADEIAEAFAVPYERIRVVAPGLSDAPTASAGTSSTGASPAGTAKRPYVLGLGTTEPRKDFPGLVAAFDLLADRHAGVELRIAGPAGWGEADLLGAIARSRHRDRIHRLGWVEDRGALLAGAAVFAYPSLYEGFGLPPLEAMACQVPVVATAAGAIPEVVGDAALLVAPGDPEALADALWRTLDDATERNRLRQAGRLRAAAFNWSSAGDGFVELYRDAAKR